MSEHDEIRALLPLAASGDLEEAEERRVSVHVARCAGCAAELEQWRGLAGDLRRLPTPQPSVALVARTRAMAQAEMAEQAEARAQQVDLVFVLMFCWALTLATWLVSRLVGGGLASWLELFSGKTSVWVAWYTLAGWLLSSVVAVTLVGWKQRAARRMA